MVPRQNSDIKRGQGQGPVTKQAAGKETSKKKAEPGSGAFLICSHQSLLQAWERTGLRGQGTWLMPWTAAVSFKEHLRSSLCRQVSVLWWGMGLRSCALEEPGFTLAPPSPALPPWAGHLTSLSLSAHFWAVRVMTASAQ